MLSVALASATLASAAAAAPPPSRGSVPSVARTGERGAADSRVTLDLRAPTAVPSLEEPRALGAESAAMPSRLTPGESMRARLEEQLPSLGTDRAVRTLSRAQQMAERFRREGFPVARLFETRSALVSLGLNQRGKPGIWLIQKLP
jgi:hypothetical protein